MSGLSLPSSDLDLVICLPKVHMEAGPDLPGVLEGRNSVKESWQQNLYRCLCNEVWVQAESIKVISNTVIPVLKLKTRDQDGLPTINLDISFEGPGHKGLDANKLISSIIKKYAPIRPLVLVLKFFLSQRRLCEAYTGGLSSYAVFLLVTRFLQELELTSAATASSSDAKAASNHADQPSELQVNDLGALLLGILRFYGDYFDPRITGVNVLRRIYFPRSSFLDQRAPTPQQFAYPAPSSSANIPVLTVQQQISSATRMVNASDRRHSFNAGRFHATIAPHSNPSFEPYKFDPICIDDPLEIGNNVGRNCFRILQVQRCLSEVANTVDSVLKTADAIAAAGTVEITQKAALSASHKDPHQPCSLKLILGEEWEKSLLIDK
jgi:hypothetical protein